MGVTGKSDYMVIFNSDLFDYSGTGLASYPNIIHNVPSKNFEVLERELELNIVAPYGVIVLKEV